jgi:DNA (cytosine-5)-methyltransferase 1
MESKHITVNELFSGIGAQRKALDRLGIAHEVVGVCEIDKYAIQSYEAIFGKTYNYGDICTAPRLDYADLWTYSFPCQDISVAGKQQGINQNTRSGLLYQVQRLLEVAKVEGTLPKYLLLENVKNLVGKQFKSQFDDWLFYLEQLGYDTYWQVLNAKNYGIPQNRERVFAISIRKDLNQTFEFPKAEELKIRLKDILEDEVDEKFYLKDSIVSSFIDKIQYQNKDNPDVINPLKDKTPYGWHFEQAVYDSNGIARAVKAGGGSGNIPKVIEPKIIEAGYYPYPNSDKKHQTNTVYNSEGISPNLNATDYKTPVKVVGDTRIRKLTPLECWRLMGFDDEDFRKAEASGVSNTQLYKQAGNSIVVNVLEKIFEKLF